jgi:hypothetical protein
MNAHSAVFLPKPAGYLPKAAGFQFRVASHDPFSQFSQSHLTHMIPIPDTIGFALLHLSLNDTKPIKWEALKSPVRRLFLQTMNKGIDRTKADIRFKDDLFTFFYNDEVEDFKAFYVILGNDVIYEYEG